MQKTIKIIVLFAIFGSFFAYGFADNVQKDNNEKNWIYVAKSEKKSEKKEKKSEQEEGKTKQKSGLVLSCTQKPGFQEKMRNIDEIYKEKIIVLDKLYVSLDEIIPLIKESKIKKSLVKQKDYVQEMKKNYENLKIYIEKNPESICGNDSVWKEYNLKTKILVENIKKQFKLLKSKK